MGQTSGSRIPTVRETVGVGAFPKRKDESLFSLNGVIIVDSDREINAVCVRGKGQGPVSLGAGNIPRSRDAVIRVSRRATSSDPNAHNRSSLELLFHLDSHGGRAGGVGLIKADVRRRSKTYGVVVRGNGDLVALVACINDPFSLRQAGLFVGKSDGESLVEFGKIVREDGNRIICLHVAAVDIRDPDGVGCHRGVISGKGCSVRIAAELKMDGEVFCRHCGQLEFHIVNNTQRTALVGGGLVESVFILCKTDGCARLVIIVADIETVGLVRGNSPTFRRTGTGQRKGDTLANDVTVFVGGDGEGRFGIMRVKRQGAGGGIVIVSRDGDITLVVAA